MEIINRHNLMILVFFFGLLLVGLGAIFRIIGSSIVPWSFGQPPLEKKMRHAMGVRFQLVGFAILFLFTLYINYPVLKARLLN
jgi:hypothetical protein